MKPKPLVPRLPKGEKSANKRLQEFLDSRNLRRTWKMPKKTALFLLLFPSLCSAGTVTITLPDQVIKDKLAFICTRISCEGKSQSDIAKEAIDAIIRMTTFRAWNLEDSDAKVKVTYSDEPI